MERGTLVEVEWVDSTHFDGWLGTDSFPDTLKESVTKMSCYSVGWLYLADSERLVIVQSFSASGQPAHGLEIPRVCIVKCTAHAATVNPVHP
jgi:hypothetical protein